MILLAPHFCRIACVKIKWSTFKGCYFLRVAKYSLEKVCDHGMHSSPRMLFSSGSKVMEGTGLLTPHGLPVDDNPSSLKIDDNQ